MSFDFTKPLVAKNQVGPVQIENRFEVDEWKMHSERRIFISKQVLQMVSLTLIKVILIWVFFKWKNASALANR
jgi:hypothetical protein